MSSLKNQPIRRPFAEFSQAIGKDMIRIRLFKESVGFLCERELVESDGTAFTQALPFRTTNEVQEFLHCDPHYSTIKRHANELLGKLASEIIDELKISRN